MKVHTLTNALPEAGLVSTPSSASARSAKYRAMEGHGLAQDQMDSKTGARPR